MKRVEKESLIKSFLLFFISQALLVGALFMINYQKELQTLDEQIFSKMRICSFDLKCKQFGIDFVSKKEQELYKLYKDQDELASYFTLPGSQKHYLKIYLQKSQYLQDVKRLQRSFLVEFLSVLLIIVLLSFLFAIYALSPLRNALRLTEEFIKDILHDFNTPLATLRLNISMLSDEFGENKKIKRVENAVQNILNLQGNLKAYLHSHVSQKELFLLSEFVQQRVELLAPNYRDVSFFVDIGNQRVETNRDALSRILDNLISNAGKYNKKDGQVFIRFENEKLIVEDTGKGIYNPKRIFERFYKEQERGIGIGLHIVKKLCDELGIEIVVESKVSEGTRFLLNFEKIIR